MTDNYLHPDESDFHALQILVENLRADPTSYNIGHYILRAYWLGEGKPLNKVLAPVEPENTGSHLSIVKA